MIKSKVSIKEAMICLRKNSYTEKEAIGQAKLYSRTIKQAIPYMCKYCNSWHIGGIGGNGAKKQWRKILRGLGKTTLACRSLTEVVDLGEGMKLVPLKTTIKE